MNILQLLANDGFIAVNKGLIKELGLLEAVMLGELVSEHLYWEDREKLEDNWFYSTIENIKNNTGLSEYQQREILKSLEGKNLIETRKKGIPAKRYIRLKLNKIQSLIFLRTCNEEIKALDTEKPKINNNKNNNKEIINNMFEQFWNKYPRKVNKKKTRDKLIHLLEKEKIDFTLIDKGLDNYIKQIKDKGTAPEYIAHPTTWLNGARWEDDYGTKEEKKYNFEEALRNYNPNLGTNEVW